MATQTILSDVVKDIFLQVHSAENPTDSEWNVVVQTAARKTIRGGIVLTDGGGPNASQRKQLLAIEGIKQRPLAVVTQSAMTRGVITALSWLGKNARGFRPDEISQIFEFVNVPQDQQTELLLALATMKARLAGHSSLHSILKVAGVPSDKDSMLVFVLTQPLSRLCAKPSER